MNMMNFAKRYGIPALVAVVVQLLFGPTLTSWFGPSLGSNTSVVVTLICFIVALYFWDRVLAKPVEKAL